jgi:DtxR family transcriptional regulator, Mn-dependent transcriptional regulator
MNLSNTEENYLKCIHKLSEANPDGVSTNAISGAINTTAASVTDMLKKLSEKGLVDYIRYKGVKLTVQGAAFAKKLVRKHRLWEVFLVNKLHFTWDEVHDIAEQLEHIDSEALVQRLDEYLGFPKFDPHGDPIPDEYGNYHNRNDLPLSELEPGRKAIVVGVRDHSTLFLQYLATQQLTLGVEVEVLRLEAYDQSIHIRTTAGREMPVSSQVAKNLVVCLAEHS